MSDVRSMLMCSVDAHRPQTNLFRTAWLTVSLTVTQAELSTQGKQKNSDFFLDLKETCFFPTLPNTKY